MKNNKIMDFFSALGRSLLMPVAALAACGIVFGLTAALNKAQVIAAVPFLQIEIVHFIITVLYKVSSVVFTLLPVLFAISISFGLATEEKEIAAFAGFIGYYTFLVASSCVINSGFTDFSALKISNILGVETVDMGAVIGIITGLITAKLHNKYHKVMFPAAISFYGGKRFVALVVIMAMTVVGLVAPFIWEPISVVINGAGGLISSSGLVGVFCFGFLERLLIPTGLHHVLNGIFRTTAIGGVYEGVEGCLNIFLQFVDKIPLSDLKPYTVFLGQGKMPMMMFGLSGAALAIYRTTPEEKKPRVKALMMAGVAASFVSGITEPLEFSFMFVAPPLFLFHAVMGGLSFMLMSALNVIIGNTGGGFIDYLIWGVFQPGSGWYWVIVVGIPFAVIYYYVFKAYLEKKQITVDVADEEDEGGEALSLDEKQKKQALAILEGLGGAGNVGVVNNCLTRLRVDVKDMGKVNEEKLKKTGAMGFVHSSETHIQVVYGPKVERIAANVREVLRSGVPMQQEIQALGAFLDGEVIALEDVKDGMFSEKMLGDGVAVLPAGNTIVAPADGTVLLVSEPSYHAVAMRSIDGMEFIIHVGLDTVDMAGDGFDCKVKVGETVCKGQPLLVFDREKIKAAGHRDVTMLVITNGNAYPIKKAYTGVSVKAGQDNVIEY